MSSWSPSAGEVRPVICRHHEQVVETLGARTGPMPLLAGEAVDELKARLLGNLVTVRARLAPLHVLAAAMPESPAIPGPILPSPPETAGKSGSQF